MDEADLLLYIESQVKGNNLIRCFLFQKLANIIRETPQGAQFSSMSDREALEWLETSGGPATVAFK